MTNPTDRKYTKEHEWAKVEGDLVVVGISDYAQDQLGDVVYVEIQPVGTKVEQFKPFGVVESVKAASDLFSPLTGEIAVINEALYDMPELVNEDCYGKGWMMKMKPSNLAELDQLWTAKEYEDYIATLEKK